MPESRAKLSAKAATGGTAASAKKPVAKTKTAKGPTKSAGATSKTAAGAKTTAAKPAAPASPPKTAAPKAPKNSAKLDASITPDQRYRMICDAAYYRAERRGFVGGNPHEDWVAAEAEVDAILNGARPS